LLRCLPAHCPTVVRTDSPLPPPESVSHSQYVLNAGQIAEASNSRRVGLHQALDSLSKTITATAVTSDPRNRFPYVTLPTFEVHAQQVIETTGAENVFFMPVVDDKELWAAYSQDHQGWIQQSLELFGSHARLSSNTSYSNDPVAPFIFSLDEKTGDIYPSTQSPSLPLWQTSPPPFNPEHINFDMLGVEWMRRLYQAMATTNEEVFSEVLGVSELSKIALSSQHHLVHEATGIALHESYAESAKDSAAYADPHSVVLYPVHHGIENEGTDLDTVGVIAAIISWDQLLADVLSGREKSFFSVLSSSCGQTFTYRVDGDTVSCTSQILCICSFIRRKYSCVWRPRHYHLISVSFGSF